MKRQEIKFITFYKFYVTVRMCERAYIEFRELMKDIIDAVSAIDEEWGTLMSYMKPKCRICTEKDNCPRLKAE